LPFSLAFVNVQKKNQYKTFNNAPGYSNKKSYPEVHFLINGYIKWLILFKSCETNKSQKKSNGTNTTPAIWNLKNFI